RGERFIHLAQIHIVESETGLLKGRARSRHRPASHNGRIYSSDAPAGQSSEWLESAFLRFGDGHQDDRSSGIDDAAGVSSCDCTVFPKRRLQFGQPFKSALWPQVI